MSIAIAAVIAVAAPATVINSAPVVTGRTTKTVPPVVIRPITIPAPSIKFTGQQPYVKDGKNWVLYTYELLNRDAYPAVFWTPAPSLPPCGANTNASRAWLDIYDGAGQRLYGYCGEQSTAQFKRFGFALEVGSTVPATVYVTITDRQTGRVFKSNSAPTGDASAPPIIH